MKEEDFPPPLPFILSGLVSRSVKTKKRENGSGGKERKKGNKEGKERGGRERYADGKRQRCKKKKRKKRSF